MLVQQAMLHAPLVLLVPIDHQQMTHLLASLVPLVLIQELQALPLAPSVQQELMLRALETPLVPLVQQELIPLQEQALVHHVHQIVPPVPHQPLVIHVIQDIVGTQLLKCVFPQPFVVKYAQKTHIMVALTML